MAKNNTDLLTLIERCSENELNNNLNILKTDLLQTDSNVSWLQLLTRQFESHRDIAQFNLYEKILMLTEIRKLMPVLLELSNDLKIAIRSTEKICQNYKFNFDFDLTRNLLLHRRSCEPCGLTETDFREPGIDELYEKYYPPRIVNFVEYIDKCCVSTVRLSPEGMMECLLCTFKVRETHLDILKEHLLNKKHLERVHHHYRHLVAFHQFWQMQKPNVWKDHFKFSVYDSSSIRCLACNKSVKHHKVTNHSSQCSEDLLQELPRGTYPMQIEELLFKNVPFIQLADNFYPVFQRNSKDVLCLICDTVVEDDQRVHVESATHIAMQDSERVLMSLKLYHDVWCSLPEDMQKWQTYFVRGLEKMTCSVCSLNMDYTVDLVREHVTSEEHLKNIEGLRMRNVQESTREQVISGKEQSHQAHCSIYKDAPTITVGNESFPAYQRHKSIAVGLYHCMICNKTVVLHDTDRHEKAAPHSLWQNEASVRDSLVKYHKVWAALPAGVQYEQVYFERRPDKMRCRICRNVFVDYDVNSVAEHLMVEGHLRGDRKRCKRKRRRKGRGVDDDGDNLTDKIGENSKSQCVPSKSCSIITLDSWTHEEHLDSIILSDKSSDNDEPESDDQQQNKRTKRNDDFARQNIVNIEKENSSNDCVEIPQQEQVELLSDVSDIEEPDTLTDQNGPSKKSQAVPSNSCSIITLDSGTHKEQADSIILSDISDNDEPDIGTHGKQANSIVLSDISDQISDNNESGIDDPPRSKKSNVSEDFVKQDIINIEEDNSSHVCVEIPHKEQDELLSDVSDIEESDFNGNDNQTQEMKISIDAEPASQTIEKKMPPDNICFDYKLPDFIPLTVYETEECTGPRRSVRIRIIEEAKLLR